MARKKKTTTKTASVPTATKSKKSSGPRTPKVLQITPKAEMSMPREGTKVMEVYKALSQKRGTEIIGVLLSALAKRLSKDGSVVNEAVARSWVQYFCDKHGAGVTSEVEGSDLRLKIVEPQSKAAA